MIHRTALFAGSLAAALTLTVGLVVVGFAPPASTVGMPTVAPVAATAAAPVAPAIQVDTVYLAAPVQPQDITVTKSAPVTAHAGDDGAGEGTD